MGAAQPASKVEHADVRGRPIPGARRVSKQADNGRLIVVVGADLAQLDLLLAMARRRLAWCERLSFVEPVATRPLPAGGGNAVARSRFAEFERMGALTLVWHHGGHAYGHLLTLLARLRSGETVVAGASGDVAAQARALWGDVKIVKLMAATDGLRAGLSSRACLSRMAGRSMRSLGLEHLMTEAADAQVRGGGDLAGTVRIFCDVIEGLVAAQSAARGEPAGAVRHSRRAGRPARRRLQNELRQL
jgi:ribose 1,5-bisphosphokinase PhnN